MDQDVMFGLATRWQQEPEKASGRLTTEKF